MPETPLRSLVQFSPVILTAAAALALGSSQDYRTELDQRTERRFGHGSVHLDLYRLIHIFQL